LKPGGNEGAKARPQRGNKFLCLGKMSTLFSCCVYQKAVMGSRSRALVWEVRLKLKPF